MDLRMKYVDANACMCLNVLVQSKVCSEQVSFAPRQHKQTSFCAFCKLKSKTCVVPTPDAGPKSLLSIAQLSDADSRAMAKTAEQLNFLSEGLVFHQYKCTFTCSGRSSVLCILRTMPLSVDAAKSDQGTNCARENSRFFCSFLALVCGSRKLRCFSAGNVSTQTEKSSIH